MPENTVKETEAAFKEKKRENLKRDKNGFEVAKNWLMLPKKGCMWKTNEQSGKAI